MAHKDNWAVIFAECFKNQPEGWAIYKKIAATKLKPGTCGYFDPSGDWQLIADLTKESELKEKGFTYVDGITVEDDPGDERWPFRRSDDVHRVQITGAANATSEALPAGGGVTATYRKSSENGAVMVTEGTVTHAQATPPHLTYNWMVQNGKALQKLVKNNPMAKRGLWVVTKTYRAHHRRLVVLTGKETDVTLSIKADVQGEADVEATAAWWQSQKTEAWIDQKMEDSVDLVLSMDGIWWEPSFFSSKVKPVTEKSNQKFLSGRTGDVPLQPVASAIEDATDPNEDVVEWVPEIKGTIPGVRMFDPNIDVENEEAEMLEE